MSDRDQPPVLILAPLAGDSVALLREVEEAGYCGRVLGNAAEFAAAMERDGPESALALIVSQEGASADLGQALANVFRSEPDWAQIPVLFLIDSVKWSPPAFRMLAKEDGRAHFMHLERPVHPPILRQMVRTFAASRERQFRTHDLLVKLSKEEERSAFLLSELRHRVRNSLAILNSLFKMSARRADSVDALAKSFGERLQNLSEAHLGLTGDVQAPLLSELISEHVSPYAASPDQVKISGEAVRLSEKTAFDLALVVHELATNAAKYGALSTGSGKVEVTWRVRPESSNLEITWRERGGPLTEAPSRSGLGTSLISSFPASADTAAKVVFETEGLNWSAEISAEDYRVIEGKE